MPKFILLGKWDDDSSKLFDFLVDIEDIMYAERYKAKSGREWTSLKCRRGDSVISFSPISETPEEVYNKILEAQRNSPANYDVEIAKFLTMLKPTQ